jgi:hypothetical protein
VGVNNKHFRNLGNKWWIQASDMEGHRPKKETAGPLAEPISNAQS